jgi:hypothetical protein
MNRRKFITTAAASPLLAPAAASGKNQYYELRYFYQRNGSQPERNNEFFGKSFIPAAKRLGIGPVGFFNPVIGEQSPYLMMLIAYSSIGEVETLLGRLMTDAEFQKGFEKYHRPRDPGYTRSENTLLKAFDVMPTLTLPPGDDKRPPRIFELRTYESNDPSTRRRKIKLFNEGEAAIFQRLGMAPVFFGEALVGRNLPHLTYMLSYDDLAARDKLWKDFGADAEWKKLRSKPENADAEIVSNISNAILRPTAYSEIR